jgi:DNA-binding response OmpR family regulator
LASPPFYTAETSHLDGFDCVIIDVTLPGDEDGFALANRAAQTPVDVILITGNPAHFERLEASGHAYLRKPFRIQELRATLDEVMTKAGHECWHWLKRRPGKVAWK